MKSLLHIVGIHEALMIENSAKADFLQKSVKILKRKLSNFPAKIAGLSCRNY